METNNQMTDRERMLLKKQLESPLLLPTGGVFPRYNTISRLKQQQAAERKISMQEIVTKIDKETLFLLAFVPHVIAEIAWDYADSCIDLASYMRLQPVKKLNRRIRELRKDYDYERKRFIDSQHREIETENMIKFQENYRDYFNSLHTSIKKKVNEEHPGLNDDSQMLIFAAYSCAVVLRAMFNYSRFMERKVADLLGIKAIGSIVAKELFELEKLVLHYAGEDSIGNNNKFPEFLNTYVDTLVQYLKQSEIIELPCPND